MKLYFRKISIAAESVTFNFSAGRVNIKTDAAGIAALKSALHCYKMKWKLPLSRIVKILTKWGFTVTAPQTPSAVVPAVSSNRGAVARKLKKLDIPEISEMVVELKNLGYTVTVSQKLAKKVPAKKSGDSVYTGFNCSDGDDHDGSEWNGYVVPGDFQD